MWRSLIIDKNVFHLLLVTCVTNSRTNSLLVILHIVLFISICDINAGDVKPKQEIYIPNYNIYHNLSTIQKHLETISAMYPNFIQLDPMYKSRHNRPQMLVRVTNYSDSTRGLLESNTTPVPKVKILLSYGEHAREFFPIESMFHLLNNLTTGVTLPRDSPEFEFSYKILSRMDLFIVAVVNPDGRHLVETTGNYCWRGTSTGVDLNRNFDWYFGNKGSSGNINDEEYRGTKPFSEPETTVLLDLTQKYKFDAFVSLHSGIKQIYVPFADTVSKKTRSKPPNLSSMLDVADRMSHATSVRFTYGVAYQLNEYTADGTIFDFMAGKRKIPFSFAIELWGEGDYKGAKCFDLFNPRSEMLKSAVADIHPLYKELFFYLIKWKQKVLLEAYDPFIATPSLVFGYVLLCIVIFVTFIVAINHRLPLCMRLFPRRRVISLRSLSSTFSIMAFRM